MLSIVMINLIPRLRILTDQSHVMQKNRHFASGNKCDKPREQMMQVHHTTAEDRTKITHQEVTRRIVGQPLNTKQHNDKRC